MNQHDMATWIRPWCALDETQPPHYARARVGSVKRSAVTWKYKPLLLSGENPAKAAADILQRLNTERGKTPTRYWIEVVQQGDTHPVACSDPGHLSGDDDANDGGENEGLAEAVRGGNVAGMVGHVMTGILGMAQQSQSTAEMLLREKSADLTASQEECRHLRTLLVESWKQRIEETMRIHELGVGGDGDDSGPMAQALGAFGGRLGDIVGPRLEKLLDSLEAQAAAAAGSGGAAGATEAPAARSTPAANPTEEIDDLLGALGIVMESNPGSITEQHYRMIKGAANRLDLLAGMRGWTLA